MVDVWITRSASAQATFTSSPSHGRSLVYSRIFFSGNLPRMVSWICPASALLMHGTMTLVSASSRSAMWLIAACCSFAIWMLWCLRLLNSLWIRYARLPVYFSRMSRRI